MTVGWKRSGAAAVVVAAGLMGIRPAVGDCCRVQRVAKVRAVQKVQVVELVPANVFYFVGAPIRQAALVQQQIRTDPLYEEFRAFREFQALKAQASAKADADPPPKADSASPEPPHAPTRGGVLAASCIKCHGGPEPKGGLDLSLPLTQALKGRIAQQVWLGKMPPEKPLGNEQAAKLFDELFKNGEDE